MRFQKLLYTTGASLIFVGAMTACGKHSGGSFTQGASGDNAAASAAPSTAAGENLTLAYAGDVQGITINRQDGSAVTAESLGTITAEYAQLADCANLFHSANAAKFWQSTSTSFDLMANDTVAIMVRDGAVVGHDGISYLGADPVASNGQNQGQSQESKDVTLKFSCTQTITVKAEQADQSQSQSQAQAQEPKKEEKVESKTETLLINVMVKAQEVKAQQEVKPVQEEKEPVQQQEVKPTQEEKKPEVKPTQEEKKPEVKPTQEEKKPAPRQEEKKPAPEVKPGQDSKQPAPEQGKGH